MGGLGVGNGERGFGYERLELAGGAAVGTHVVGPWRTRVDTVHRRCRLTVVVSGARLGDEIASVQLEAALLSADGVVWYPVAAAVPVAAGDTVAVAHDADVVGVQVRLKAAVSTRTSSPITVEIAQT